MYRTKYDWKEKPLVSIIIPNKEHRKDLETCVNSILEKTTYPNLAANMAKAFVMGGIICCIGQFILNICKSLGLDKEMSGSWCSILLILLSVILTGLNLYPSLANWGGAGALVPITGFANGVAAPAIEFQKEGQVFGIGAGKRLDNDRILFSQAIDTMPSVFLQASSICAVSSARTAAMAPPSGTASCM